MEKTHKELIENIIHGFQGAYELLRILQGALDCKGKIRKEYLHGKNAEFIVGEFGISITKKEIKEVRKQLILEITDTILNQKKTEFDKEMMPDNYSRLFHALAILKLDKKTDLFPGTTDNLIYNASYMLWRLDDGSEIAEKAIEDTMWFMAEEIKGRSGEVKSECLKGLKC